MKKYMPLEGLRWSRDSGSTLCDTPQNGRSRTGWGGGIISTFRWIRIFSRVFFVNLDFWCIFVPSSIEVAKFMALSVHLSSGISMKSFFWEPRRNTWLIWTACVSLGSFSFMPALLCLSLSICFVDIYGLVLLCRGLGRYPLEDDTYIYCFLL